MAVPLISCYFLPFLLFFAAQLVLPKSPAAFAFGLAGLSIGTLILYFLLKDQKKIVHVPVSVPAAIKEPVAATQTKPAPAKIEQSNIAKFAQKALKHPVQYKPQTKKALIEEQKLLLEQQKNYFLHEGEKNTQAINELQEALQAARQALEAKQAELHNMDTAYQAQAAEMANLKFEMYTLLRIDSYMADKDSSKNLAATSL